MRSLRDQRQKRSDEHTEHTAKRRKIFIEKINREESAHDSYARPTPFSLLMLVSLGRRPYFVRIDRMLGVRFHA